MLIRTIFVVVISFAVLGIALIAFKGRAIRRNRTAEVWSETDVDYQARDDLVPNLEETLKMYGFPQTGGPGAHADQAAPSPQPVAGPGPAGRRRHPERAPRQDSLAEAS
jgi:hypothetical protein